MNRSGARVLGGFVIVEIFAIILLLIFRTCCPIDAGSIATASEGAELVLFQPATDVGPNPFLDLPDRTKAGRQGEIELTTDPNPDIGQVGTYGGTTENTCDPELLKEFLTDINPAKGRAWAEAQGIEFADIESFIDGLTPTALTKDTYITNYGFKNGLTSNPSVLAKGTAVLVDETGAPVVRCMCGNPIENRKQPPPPPPEFDCIITREGRLAVFEAETGYRIEGAPVGTDLPVTVLSFTPITIEDIAFATVEQPDGSIIDVSIGALQGDCLPDWTLCVSYGPAAFIEGAPGAASGTLPVETVVSITGGVTPLNGIGYVDATWMSPDGSTGAGKVDVSTSVDIALSIPQSNPCLPEGDCTVIVESLVTNPNDANTFTVQVGALVSVVSYDFSNGPEAYITSNLGVEGPIAVSALEGDCQAITEIESCVNDGPLPYIDEPAGQSAGNLGPNQVVTVTGGVRVSGNSQWVGVTWTDATGTYDAFARSDGLFPLDDCVPDPCTADIEVTITDGIEATLVVENLPASQVTFANEYPFDFSLIDVDLADGRTARVSIADFVGSGCEFPGFAACTAVDLFDFGGPLLITVDETVLVTGWDVANAKYQVVDGNAINALAGPGELKPSLECGVEELVIDSTT
ncbi:MAG: DUF6777 domain-containing protein, partial [Ilumatobacter sp.]